MNSSTKIEKIIFKFPNTSTLICNIIILEKFLDKSQFLLNSEPNKVLVDDKYYNTCSTSLSENLLSEFLIISQYLESPIFPKLGVGIGGQFPFKIFCKYANKQTKDKCLLEIQNNLQMISYLDDEGIGLCISSIKIDPVDQIYIHVIDRYINSTTFYKFLFGNTLRFYFKFWELMVTKIIERKLIPLLWHKIFNLFDMHLFNTLLNTIMNAISGKRDILIQFWDVIKYVRMTDSNPLTKDKIYLISLYLNDKIIHQSVQPQDILLQTTNIDKSRERLLLVEKALLNKKSSKETIVEINIEEDNLEPNSKKQKI